MPAIGPTLCDCLPLGSLKSDIPFCPPPSRVPLLCEQPNIICDWAILGLYQRIVVECFRGRHRGGAILLCVLRTPLACSKMSLLHLKACTIGCDTCEDVRRLIISQVQPDASSFALQVNQESRPCKGSVMEVVWFFLGFISG